MTIFGKKGREDIHFAASPQETMGFSKEGDLMMLTTVQNYLIKKYTFNTLDQVKDIKRQLLGRRILIINTKELFENENIPRNDLKRAIEEIRAFLVENGGSMGRLGEQYLIITPNSQVKISN
jgi:SepF-like predicted cell division protein (DUF552 family)